LPRESIQTVVFEGDGNLSFPLEERTSLLALTVWLIQWSEKASQFDPLLEVLNNSKNLTEALLVDAPGQPLQEGVQRHWIAQTLVAPLLRQYVGTEATGEWNDWLFEDLLAQ